MGDAALTFSSNGPLRDLRQNIPISTKAASIQPARQPAGSARIQRATPVSCSLEV